MNLTLRNSSIEAVWMSLQQWEKIYNIVHVAMMCILPYLMELIFYALILSLLSEAKKGEFSGLKRSSTQLSRRLLRFCPMKRKKRKEEITLESVQSSIDVNSDSPQRTRNSVRRIPNSGSGADDSRVPWLQTVIVVRRNARRKVFLMLSFNLILWLPYFTHAILSPFIRLDYYNFQFACALVVFNAITNILL
ncbi:hypothetical protein PENTCL1PPCAC_16078 [Pristionchus entomophagus]|uniref:G protein-coupled receptor n=1 Tax=Pristionchus entomophagus TaxID=358040 RepID=A0AAV5TI59_9BILA|nr:hypothetical protein PENTCL1PPCAC_16078 [Pristionchus entomophagus]